MASPVLTNFPPYLFNMICPLLNCSVIHGRSFLQMSQIWRWILRPIKFFFCKALAINLLTLDRSSTITNDNRKLATRCLASLSITWGHCTCTIAISLRARLLCAPPFRVSIVMQQFHCIYNFYHEQHNNTYIQCFTEWSNHQLRGHLIALNECAISKLF